MSLGPDGVSYRVAVTYAFCVALSFLFFSSAFFHATTFIVKLGYNECGGTV